MKTIMICLSLIAALTIPAHAEPRKTLMGAFEGTCTMHLVAGWFNCDSHVGYMVLPNGRSFIQFQRGKESFAFAGGHDRQPLYLSIDTMRIMKGAKVEGVDKRMEGECHLVFNDDASEFETIHCDV